MAHRNARTTVYARRLIVERFLTGWPAARIAEQLGVSRATVHKWVRRHRDEGWDGLADRPSRPHTSPTRTAPEVETAILALRRKKRRGPVFLAGELGLLASTVGRVLRRHRVPAPAAVDPITGLPVRRRRSGVRYERRSRASCCTSMSRSWAGSPMAAAGAHTGAMSRSAGAGPATTTCTSRSTTHLARRGDAVHVVDTLDVAHRA
ncbi:MAG: leucine zipper domain-containing protein [Pseudonocardia sp.]